MGAASYYNLGIALHAEGDDAAALGHYQSALEIVPSYPEALWAAGISFAARREFDQAIASYRAAIALRPDVGAMHHSLAGALSKSGDIAAALQHYEEALRLEPDLVEAHFHLAIALAISARGPEGLRHAESAVALDPSWLARLRDVAWRRATMPGVGRPGSPDGRLALQLARWCARLTKPQTARSLDLLAASHAAVGRFRAAAQIGRNAIALASEAGDPQLAAVIQRHVSRYENRRALARDR
jgi:tetratricopeptide (TPR) repeat protein